MKLIPLFIIILISAQTLSAQQIEIPIKDILQDKEIAQGFQKSNLLAKFIESHQSDSISIEFSLTADHEKWARFTSATMDGKSGADSDDLYVCNEVFRIQPMGPEADDGWEEYLYVVSIKKGNEMAAAIISFRCMYSFPEKITPGGEPMLKKLEVLSKQSVIK